MLKSGFFAVEVIPKVLEKESAITKVLKNLNLVFLCRKFQLSVTRSPSPGDGLLV